MLLTQTASSAPIFILIGAGLVWQTLPAGWVDISESHYTFESHYTIMGSAERASGIDCNSFTCTMSHLLSEGHAFVLELAPSSFEKACFGPEGKRGVVPKLQSC